MTKNILIINTVPAGFNGITGVILNYVRETCRTVRCDFVLCCGAEEAVRTKLESFGGELFVPPCSRRKHPLLYSAWLKRLLRHRHYDVVHVHGNSGTMYFDIHAAARAGVPVRIAHCHSTSCRFQLVHRLLKPFLNRELTHAAACSEAAGRWLFDGPYTVLPNGIDSQKFAYSEQTRGRYRDALDLNGQFVIGHVGYMEEVKNHMFLLRVFRKLLERGCSVRLLLIGDGTLRPEIERYIAENGLSDAVLLLGKRSDAAELYQSMDVFVLPSLYEGLPLTLVEAQASGLPCIVSETVTREADITGTLRYLGIGNGDETVWADALAALVSADAPRRSRADAVAAAGFDIGQCTGHLLDMYSQPRTQTQEKPKII